MSCNRLSTYLVVDISKGLLGEHLPKLSEDFPDVTCIGLWGSFDYALRFFKGKLPRDQVCLLSLANEGQHPNSTILVTCRGEVYSRSRWNNWQEQSRTIVFRPSVPKIPWSWSGRSIAFDGQRTAQACYLAKAADHWWWALHSCGMEIHRMASWTRRVQARCELYAICGLQASSGGLYLKDQGGWVSCGCIFRYRHRVSHACSEWI